jgi:hypothetical protein
MGETQTMLFGATEANPSEFACTSSKSVQRRLAAQIVKPSCEETGTGLNLAAKHDGPMSSKLAGADIERDGTRRRQIESVVNAVRTYPGHTSRELSVMAGIDRYTAGRRMSEAETLGLIKRGEKMKRCSQSGKLALAWEAR